MFAQKSVSTDTEIVSGEINQRTREQAPGSLERDRGFQLNERGGKGEGFSRCRSHHRYLIRAFQSAISFLGRFQSAFNRDMIPLPPSHVDAISLLFRSVAVSSVQVLERLG